MKHMEKNMACLISQCIHIVSTCQCPTVNMSLFYINLIPLNAMFMLHAMSSCYLIDRIYLINQHYIQTHTNCYILLNYSAFTRENHNVKDNMT